MSGGAITGTINYTGLEPISNDGTASDIIFNLPVGGTNSITMDDEGTTGNTISRLRGVTIETTTFANPSNSLTINRGNATDNLTISGPVDFNAALTLGAVGAEFNQINFEGTLALSANKNLAAYSSTSINLLALSPNVSTSGTGTITMIAARSLVVGLATVSVVNGDMTPVGKPASGADRRKLHWSDN
jgi:hypothetical protein